MYNLTYKIINVNVEHKKEQVLGKQVSADHQYSVFKILKIFSWNSDIIYFQNHFN